MIIALCCNRAKSNLDIILMPVGALRECPAEPRWPIDMLYTPRYNYGCPSLFLPSVLSLHS